MSGRFARSAGVVAAAAGVVVLALAVGAMVVVRSGTANQWLRAHIAERLGPRVHFAAAEVMWWPRPGLSLDDVSVVADGGDPGSLTAARLTCRLRLSALLHGDVVLATLNLDGVRIRAAIAAPSPGDPVEGVLAWIGANVPAEPMPVVRVHDGEVDLHVVPAGGDDGAAGATAARSIVARGVDAQFTPDGAGARLELSAHLEPSGSLDARAALTSLAQPSTATLNLSANATELDAAAVSAWLPHPADVAATGQLRLSVEAARNGAPPLAGEATIELSGGALSGSDWRIDGPVRLSARPTWDGNTVAFPEGRLEATRLVAAGVSADTVSASFSYADGALHIPAAELHAYGGGWHGAGRIVLGPPASIDGMLSVTALDAGALGAALAAQGLSTALPRCEAPLQLNVTGSGTVGGAWTARADVDTDGAVVWREGRADGPLHATADLTGAGAAIRSVIGSGGARRVTVPALVVDSVESAFEYDGGALRFVPVRGSAFGGTWSYRGTVPLDSAGQWSGELSAGRADAAALAAAAGGAVAAAAARGTVDGTIRLSGTGTSAITGNAQLRLASTTLTIGDDLGIDGPARLGVTVQYRNGQVRVADGQIRARGARYGPLTAETAAVAFGAEPGGPLRIGSAEATAFGARWQGHGKVVLGGAPRWNGTLTAAHVDFDSLLAAAGQADEDGPRSRDGIANIHVEARQETDGHRRGTVQIQLIKGTFSWDELQVEAPAQARGNVALDGRGLSLSGVSATAAHAAYGPLVCTHATAQFRYANDRLTFDTLHFTSAGGAWTHSGWFTLAERGPFNGQLTLTGVQPSSLAAMLDETDFDLPFARADLDAQFDGIAAADWQETLQLTGSVVLKDGTMRSTTILRPIWDALIGPGRLQGQIDRPTRVQELSDTFALRQGRFDTGDLSLISDDYNVTGVGSIGMDGTLDLQTRIQLTAMGVQKLFLFAALPLPTGSLPPLPPIPARVTGPISAPIVRPNVAALPASSAAWLVGALMHAPRSIAGAVVDGVGQLWNGVGRLFGRAPAPPPADP